MFSLDYRTICQTLTTMRYTGAVRASIPSGTLAKGTVYLTFQRGVIQVGVVITADGQRVTDLNIIAKQLTRCGLFEWFVEALPQTDNPDEKAVFATSSSAVEAPTQQSSTPTAEMPVPVAGIYPQRLPVDASWISTWPLMYRQVYNLSTGQHSEKNIARLLRSSPGEIHKIFLDLERMGALRHDT